MSTNKDGGPAFPVGETKFIAECGMSLRDYFAANALKAARADIAQMTVGACAKLLNIEVHQYSWETHYYHLVSIFSYRYADAMLKAGEASRD